MKTIVLTGMSGAGKTSVGKILAQKIGADFVDCDIEIEKRENKKITEIFSKYGEEYFRNLETRIIKDVFKNENLVLALGGGSFQNEDTRNFLLKNSTVVYLKTSPEGILERLKNCTDRPLLNNNMNLEHLKSILINRTKNYELARYMIMTDNKTKEAVSEEILKCVNSTLI